MHADARTSKLVLRPSSRPSDMIPTFFGVLLGTLAEAFGFAYWHRSLARDDVPSGVAGLAIGGMLGWILTAFLVCYSPASHPRRTNKVNKALILLFALAIYKVGLWVAWQWLIPRAGLTAACAVLAVGLHYKHALAIHRITGRSLQPTLWNPITGLATLFAVGGAATWTATLSAGGAEALAFALWLAYSTVENLLQFHAGGLFDPPPHAQAPFSIVTEVERGHVPTVKAFFAPFDGNPLAVRKQFHGYERLHFCSFMLLEHSSGDATLVFEGNIDGPALTFLRDLAATDKAFLDSAYAGSVGYPAGGTSLQIADYLAEHDYGASALYVGQPGATRVQIERDEELRKAVQVELDVNRAKYVGLAPGKCREEIAKHVDSLGTFAWTMDPVKTLLRVRFGLRILYAALLGIVVGLAGLAWAVASFDGYLILFLAVAAIAVGLASLATAYVLWLRHREKNDKVNEKVAPLAGLLSLQKREDVQLQNHLVSLTDVKAGWLRLLTIRAVLVAVDMLARYFATRGNLSGIVTIHFARWVVLARPNRRAQLLFLSNYDGSWENYLGEFVDRASNGLTAVWSNTRLVDSDDGFPRTHWLFLIGGSRDEQWFKNYARLSQRADLLWYSAYPDLTMKHIANNREFRQGLHGSVSNVEHWLQRL